MASAIWKKNDVLSKHCASVTLTVTPNEPFVPAFIISHGLMNVGRSDVAPYTLNKFTITKFVVKNQIPRKYRVSIILDPVSTRMGRFYSISIGSVCRNGSITNSESSFTGVCTVRVARWLCG